jgi:hypothetical protein
VSDCERLLTEEGGLPFRPVCIRSWIGLSLVLVSEANEGSEGARSEASGEQRDGRRAIGIAGVPAS